MDFIINENQMIADMVQKFGKHNITPFVRDWDDNQTFPADVFKKVRRAWFNGSFSSNRIWWSRFFLH